VLETLLADGRSGDVTVYNGGGVGLDRCVRETEATGGRAVE
jgi:hypothetical protein